MPTQSVVSSLRDLCAAVPSKHVVERLADRIRPMSTGRKIHFEFFSLGDILKGTIVLAAFRAAFRNLNISVRLREEYHDKDEVLAAVARRYSAEVVERPPSECPTIAIFDTKVAAYRARTKEYPAVIPAQHLTVLHGIGVGNAGRVVRRILGISPRELVLVIGCYTSTELRSEDLRHIKVPLIQRDFIDTHAARYISRENLEAVLNSAATWNHFDRVILVPRNISEEIEQIRKLEALPFVEVVTDQSRKVPLSRVLLLMAKGVLRAAYAAANVSVVMGYHNVLEPFLCNPEARTYCFEPPPSAPNRFLFDCGVRHGLLKSLGSIPSVGLDVDGFLGRVHLDSFASDRKGFEKDPLFEESLECTACAISNALQTCSIA
jgi:hypothetical protein